MQKTHYHVNMASILRLGEWFDFMRTSGVWDNTRIIIVSDHGKSTDRGTEGLGFFDYMIMKAPEIDVEIVNPLLLVKDFGGSALETPDDFMTVADVPFIATKGVISDVVNPFSGKKIFSSEEKKKPQLITTSHKSRTKSHEQNNIFDTSDGHWFSVHDDIFKEENWKQID